MQPLQQALLLGGQVGHHAMEKERGFVEQAFRRLNAFDHDAARHGMKLGVLLRRQLPAGEHHDWNIREVALDRHLLEHLEAGHIRQAEIEHHTIAGGLAHERERLRAGGGRHDLDVIVTE